MPGCQTGTGSVRPGGAARPPHWQVQHCPPRRLEARKWTNSFPTVRAVEIRAMKSSRCRASGPEAPRYDLRLKGTARFFLDLRLETRKNRARSLHWASSATQSIPTFATKKHSTGSVDKSRNTETK